MPVLNRSKGIDPLLVLVVAVALVVRFWGIDFGLPHTECRPDESRIVSKAVGFFSGDLNPHFFNYPTFYIYLLFLVFGGYFLGGALIGKFESLTEFLILYKLDPSPFHLIDRCLAAFLGAATVFVVYRVSKRLFDRRTGLAAALFLALSSLHVRDSHFGVTDVPMTFLIVCSLLFIARVLESGRARDYLLAGLFAGLAASTKYSGVLLVLPLLAAHLFRATGGSGLKPSALLDRKLWLFGGVLVAAFLLGTPYALLDFANFKAGFLSEMAHLDRGHGPRLGSGWWYHLRYSLFLGLGWSLFFASLAGLLLLVMTRFGKGILLLAFPIAYYALSGKGNTVFIRYAIPMLPFLCIAGAYFTIRVCEILTRNDRGGWKRLVPAAATILIILPAAGRTIAIDRLLAREDNRLVVTRWVEGNIPEGASIAQFGCPWGKLQLRVSRKILEDRLRRAALKPGRRDVIEARLARQRREGTPGYALWEHDPETGRFSFNRVEQKGLPRYIIIQTTSLVVYADVNDKLSESLGRHYTLIETIAAAETENTANWYDQQDMFFLPFAGFEEITRPGPGFLIYERTPD